MKADEARPTHLDLFSGIGGFSLAFEAEGFHTIGFSEIEPYACAVLQSRFGAFMADTNGTRKQQSRRGVKEGRRWIVNGGKKLIPNYGDIRNIPTYWLRGVDVLTGGFPCQPFSLAGKRRGARDDRALWPAMFKAIAEVGPRWVLAENVPGIINMELDRVLSDLEACGYTARPIVIPACAVDARHRRDRVWIVAHAARQLRNGIVDARQSGGGV